MRIYWVNHLYTIKGKNSKPHPSVFNYTDVRLDWCSTRLIQYQSSEVPDWSSTSLGGAVPDWSSLCAHVWPKSVFLLRSCSSFRRRRTRRSCVCVRESKILRRTSESVRVDWRGRGTRCCCLVLAVWVRPTWFICFTVYTFTLTLSVQLQFLLSALGSCVCSVFLLNKRCSVSDSKGLNPVSSRGRNTRSELLSFNKGSGIFLWSSSKDLWQTKTII